MALSLLRDPSYIIMTDGPNNTITSLYHGEKPSYGIYAGGDFAIQNSDSGLVRLSVASGTSTAGTSAGIETQGKMTFISGQYRICGGNDPGSTGIRTEQLPLCSGDIVAIGNVLTAAATPATVFISIQNRTQPAPRPWPWSTASILTTKNKTTIKAPPGKISPGELLISSYLSSQKPPPYRLRLGTVTKKVEQIEDSNAQE